MLLSSSVFSNLDRMPHTLKQSVAFFGYRSNITGWAFIYLLRTTPVVSNYISVSVLISYLWTQMILDLLPQGVREFLPSSVSEYTCSCWRETTHIMTRICLGMGNQEPTFRNPWVRLACLANNYKSKSSNMTPRGSYPNTKSGSIMSKHTRTTEIMTHTYTYKQVVTILSLRAKHGSLQTSYIRRNSIHRG